MFGNSFHVQGNYVLDYFFLKNLYIQVNRYYIGLSILNSSGRSKSVQGSSAGFMSHDSDEGILSNP